MKLLTSARWVSRAAAVFALAPLIATARSKNLRRWKVRTLLRSNELAMGMQRHQYPEACQQRDHGSSAVTNQGQRYSDDREDPAHHAGIDEHIDEEAQCDGAA